MGCLSSLEEGAALGPRAFGILIRWEKKIMTSSLKLTASSELMSNYKQVEVLDQRRKFLAVQTEQGHSLFFGIGTDDRLYLIQEKVGTTTGWEKVELSAGLTGKVKTFDVAQNHVSGHIDVAVALTDSGADTLYLSMGNSYTDLGWTQNISLSQVLDDRRQPRNPKLEIASIYLAESSSGTEYAIVETQDSDSLIERYWIDANGAQKWNPHPLPVGLDAGGALSSYLGRKAGDAVDGIYTMGTINQLLQLIYKPLYSPFDRSVAPNSTNFDLTRTSLTPTNAAFSTCKAASGAPNATDVFIAGGGSLYYLSAEKQTQLAKPEAVLENDLFVNVRQLYASTSRTKVVIWGLDDANQIFYTACKLSEVTNPKSWSAPLPIMTGVSEASPYVDRANDGLTIFANAGDDVILKGIQDPVSTLWKFDRIELPAGKDDAKATKALSYTTTLHVTDENNIPAAGADVTMIAGSRTNVYINNLYYALDANPITVKTDANGGINIIEWVSGLQATTFSFHTGNGAPAVQVDPMATPLKKMGTLNTKQALEGARITNRDGTTRPLLPSSLSDADKQALAKHVSNLHTAYTSVSSNNAAAKPAGVILARSITVGAPSSAIDYIEVAAGDVLRFLEHEAKHEIQLFEDEVHEIWHFIVTIAGELYGFVLDTVDKIAGALEAIWKKFVEGIEDLIHFLEFLFDWNDMVRTKDVMKQCIKIFFHRIGEDLQTARESLDEDIRGAEDMIREWVGDSPSFDLGDSNHSLHATLANSTESSRGHSAPSKMLQSHFAANVGRSTTTIRDPTTVTPDPTWAGLTDLSDFLTAEQDSINHLKDQIKLLVVSPDGLANPDLSAILERIVGEIAIMAMELFKAAADKVLDLLTLLIDEMIAVLDAPIYIPIVSDILEDLYGITAPSILDVVCLIGAVPATIVYKAIHGRAPFPGGSESLHEKITAATSFADLQRLFDSPGDEITLSDDARAILFETGHLISGIATNINGVLVILDEETDGAAKTVLETPKTITSVVATVTLIVGNLFVMPAPLKNEAMKSWASSVTKVNILQKVAFLVAPKAIAKISGIKTEEGLKELAAQVGFVKGGITAILSLVGSVPPCYHILEIVADVVEGEDSATDATLGIMESTQDITSKLSTVVGFAALVDDEEASKQVLVIVQAVLIEITGGLQLAEVAVEAARPQTEAGGKDRAVGRLS